MQKFEWDSAKEALNVRKHGVSFEVDAHVFADPFALAAQDRIENGERRWQTIGITNGYLVLVVAHTVQTAEDGGEVIRIISARRADSKERRRYEQSYLS